MIVMNRTVLVLVLAGAGAFDLVGGLSCVRDPDAPSIFYSNSAGCGDLAGSPADGGAAADAYVVGDLNGSGHVDISDLLIFAWTNGKSFGDPGFNPEADFNCDYTVDVADLLILAQNWGV